MRKILFNIILFSFIFCSNIYANDLIIGLVDGGTDFTDKEINKRLWKNENEIPGNNIDDDNNGYIDDVYGWNFVSMNGFVWENNSVDSHGTVVINNMLEYNNEYVLNQNNIKIMNIKVYDGKDNFTKKATAEQIADYAYKMGARIICLPMQFDMDNPIEFDNLVKKYPDMLIVKSAGNKGQNFYSDHRHTTGNSFNNLIIVGALDMTGNLADYSNYGKGVDVYVGGTYYYPMPNEDKIYAKYEGTSFSVPKVVSQCIEAINNGISLDKMKEYIINKNVTNLSKEN